MWVNKGITYLVLINSILYLSNEFVIQDILLNTIHDFIPYTDMEIFIFDLPSS